jgi:hypothetical protein
MRLTTPFDPIEVGETDTFAFDFTLDMGSASIIDGSFSCFLSPFQSIVDSDPQSHVLSTSILTTIAIRVPPNSALVQRAGNYVVASIGNLTSDLAGGTYVLSASAILSDGRTLSLNSTVLCKAPGD